MFPLVKLHPKAYEKSMTIVCKKSLALWKTTLPAKNFLSECKTKEIDENLKLGERLGISGTPAIIFPDGSIARGDGCRRLNRAD